MWGALGAPQDYNVNCSYMEKMDKNVKNAIVIKFIVQIKRNTVILCRLVGRDDLGDLLYHGIQQT